MTCFLDLEADLQRVISNHGRRAPSTFRQGDVTRAIKATKAAGVNISRIEIDRAGKIIIIATTEAAHIEAGEQNEWDQVR